MAITYYPNVPSGFWGVKSTAPIYAGQSVTVTKASGKTKTETIDSIVRSDGGIYLASIVGAGRCDFSSRRPRRNDAPRNAPPPFVKEESKEETQASEEQAPVSEPPTAETVFSAEATNGPNGNTAPDGTPWASYGDATRLAERAVQGLPSKGDVDRAIKSALDPLRAEINAARTVSIVVQDLPPINVGAAHMQFETLVRLIRSGHHVYVYGEAGDGKSHAVIQAGKALGLDLRIQGATNDQFAFSGFVDASGNYHATPFYDAFVNGHAWSIDEVDRCSNEAILWLNAALANGVATFPNSPIPVTAHANFRAIVTANTAGSGPDAKYVGATRLDAAFTSRFWRLAWKEDLALEIAVNPWSEWTKEVQAARAWTRQRGIRGVMITPRDSRRGPDGLACGLDLDTVRRASWASGLTEAQYTDAKRDIAASLVSDRAVAEWLESLETAEMSEAAQ